MKWARIQRCLADNGGKHRWKYAGDRRSRECQKCGVMQSATPAVDGRSTMSGWDGDVYVAEDGRTFAIFSEHVRGEPRFYWAQQVLHDGDGSRTGWRSVPTAHGHDRRAVKRRVERYVRETPA